MSGAETHPSPNEGSRDQVRGIGVSPGVAIGVALVLENRSNKIFRVRIPRDRVDAEVERFRRAVDLARSQLREIRERVCREIGTSYAGVFDAQVLILDDAAFAGETEAQICSEQVNAEWALSRTARRFLDAFSHIDDPYIRDRGHDIEDVHTRLQKLLAGNHQQELSDLSTDTVVVAPVVSPSDTILLKHHHVVGFCTDVGGRTSHTAIIANALEIPAVVGLHDLSPRVQTGQKVILDGTDGVVILDPPPAVLEEYGRKREAFARLQAEYAAVRERPGVTADGVRVALRANIELPQDVDSAERFGAEGVGLYRSEFLFLEHSPDLPTEEDHFRVYRMLAERTGSHGAVIRTLDLGGEKYFHDVLDKGEANPVMGMRAVRFCLKRPDIFKSQLRGILRASAFGNLKVMFPLISGVDELRQVRAVLEDCREELRREGKGVGEKLPVGIMIEVPSAAAIADLLAREVDFFSIGTNDLIQYCLALDRGNEELSYLYEPLHPAVLRTLCFVVRAGREAGIGVSLCGEMGADPLQLPVLLGLGLEEFSMNPVAVPRVKLAVGSVNVAHAREVVDRAMSLSSTREIAALIEKELLLGLRPRKES